MKSQKKSKNFYMEDSYVDIKGYKYCHKCDTELQEETELDYPYYCPNCDENMYEFETKKKN